MLGLLLFPALLSIFFHNLMVVVAADNVKALFRRGKAHVGAWNPQLAKEDFKRVSELDSSLVKTCAKELQNLEKLEKDKDKEDRDKLKNMF